MSIDVGIGITILGILLAALGAAFAVSSTYKEPANEALAVANTVRVPGVAGSLAGLIMVGVAGSRVLHDHGSRAAHHRVPTHDWQTLGYWVAVLLISVGTLVVVSLRRRAFKKNRKAVLGETNS